LLLLWSVLPNQLLYLLIIHDAIKGIVAKGHLLTRKPGKLVAQFRYMRTNVSRCSIVVLMTKDPSKLLMFSIELLIVILKLPRYGWNALKAPQEQIQ
jgi:hypothetical protein